MTTLNRDDMDYNTAIYAAIAYVVADLDEMLPRPDDGTFFCTGAVTSLLHIDMQPGRPVMHGTIQLRHA